MIRKQTQLKIHDNSGAKFATCLHSVGKGRKKTADIGSFILVTLKTFLGRKKVKKRTMYLGLVVGVTYWVRRLEGILIKFFSNRVLLFDKQYKFLGTRVYGGVLKEVKIKNLIYQNTKAYFQKVISYCSFLV